MGGGMVRGGMVGGGMVVGNNLSLSFLAKHFQ